MIVHSRNDWIQRSLNMRFSAIMSDTQDAVARVTLCIQSVAMVDVRLKTEAGGFARGAIEVVILIQKCRVERKAWWRWGWPSFSNRRSHPPPTAERSTRVGSRYRSSQYCMRRTSVLLQDLPSGAEGAGTSFGSDGQFEGTARDVLSGRLVFPCPSHARVTALRKPLHTSGPALAPSHFPSTLSLPPSPYRH